MTAQGQCLDRDQPEDTRMNFYGVMNTVEESLQEAIERDGVTDRPSQVKARLEV
jgi:hypothetical protein